MNDEKFRALEQQEEAERAIGCYGMMLIGASVFVVGFVCGWLVRGAW